MLFLLLSSHIPTPDFRLNCGITEQVGNFANLEKYIYICLFLLMCSHCHYCY
uniref:Uncharacterized protein n=1 Tax=Anguilla anguilla TaxID=7936 RepID=A0A0E9QFC5_ANGAN